MGWIVIAAQVFRDENTRVLRLETIIRKESYLTEKARNHMRAFSDEHPDQHSTRFDGYRY